MLKPALLPHANTQSPDVIAYLPADYTTSWTSLAKIVSRRINLIKDSDLRKN